ncbi:hypothetical protein [Nostoc mirabile]|uniref:hypothetical protein n=1 Tax=Nostoc mirabile TaxID=2907820 RepID=UPI001E48235C|nr:hypothetical protein [Nostoc mirabile]
MGCIGLMGIVENVVRGDRLTTAIACNENNYAVTRRRAGEAVTKCKLNGLV